MLNTLIIKNSICRILLFSNLALACTFSHANEQNDWNLVNDTDNNLTYFELKSDESVKYIVDTKDFRLKHLDNDLKTVTPIEIGLVLKIEDLSLHGKVQKKTSNDGTTGICFFRQASTPSGSINLYNNYLQLFEKNKKSPRVTYVFLSNTPCSQSLYIKGRFFVSRRISIDDSKGQLANIYELKLTPEQITQVKKGKVRLNIDSHYIELINR